MLSASWSLPRTTPRHVCPCGPCPSLSLCWTGGQRVQGVLEQRRADQLAPRQGDRRPDRQELDPMVCDVRWHGLPAHTHALQGACMERPAVGRPPQLRRSAGCRGRQLHARHSAAQAPGLGGTARRGQDDIHGDARYGAVGLRVTLSCSACLQAWATSSSSRRLRRLACRPLCLWPRRSSALTNVHIRMCAHVTAGPARP